MWQSLQYYNRYSTYSWNKNHSTIPGTAFRRVRKITKNEYWLRHAYLSVRPSVHLPASKTSTPTDRNFVNLDTSRFIENLTRKLNFLYNMTSTTGTLHKDPYIFMTVPRWILHRMIYTGCGRNNSHILKVNKNQTKQGTQKNSFIYKKHIWCNFFQILLKLTSLKCRPLLMIYSWSRSRK